MLTLKNIEMAFSAYEDVLSQNNMSMPTLLTTFDDLRRVTHEWIDTARDAAGGGASVINAVYDHRILALTNKG